MSIFEQILHTNLINFIIVLSLLVLIFKKAHLGDLIDKMANDIQDKVEKSAADAAGSDNLVGSLLCCADSR
jgi:F0F1-type ATP synthase membrane subunit b/b'